MKRLAQHPIAQAALARILGFYLAFALRTMPPVLPLWWRSGTSGCR
jgi:hypothetical protein